MWMDRARKESSHIQTTVGLAGNVEPRKNKGHSNLINLESGILPWGELRMPLSSSQ